MLERTLWLATFALLLTGGVLLWRRYLEQQTKRLAFAQIPTELAALPLASVRPCCTLPPRPARSAAFSKRRPWRLFNSSAVHCKCSNWTPSSTNGWPIPTTS